MSSDKIQYPITDQKDWDDRHVHIGMIFAWRVLCQSAGLWNRLLQHVLNEAVLQHVLTGCFNAKLSFASELSGYIK